MSRTKNRLAEQTSPYLQQHADNPVDWYPWGEEALSRAREEDRPILLSIGYSACHWCHVMAHESFEDEATARVMNRLFINIKVDREERPDLDKIYQSAHALITQRSGGWPLTLFLSPRDQVPFFAGTYFPDQARHGLPAFSDLLQRVAAYYRQNRQAIEEQNLTMRQALAEIYGTPPSQGSPLSGADLDRAYEQLERSFDSNAGGFGAVPKFPHVTDLELLLRRARDSQGPQAAKALHMVHLTLSRMAEGGIYDQLGGGFCRYSVDEYWVIPHFEKMLYDNGPLLGLYSEMAALSGEPLFRRVATETAGWVIREMQSPEGGYYSTLDADSEGEEGRFYIWTPQEVRALLNEADYAVFARRFGLDQTPNFEGRWHLHVHARVEAIAKALRLEPTEVEASLQRARQRLFEVRERRPRPGRDEKILTSWNGLMIKGMAAAARHLLEPEFATSAQRAVDFIRQTLWTGERLLATYKDGKAHLNAYLDDYAFLIDGILELLQVAWRSEDLALAQALAELLLARFEDPVHGGLYFTASDHEQLVQRPKSYADESTPAGNAVAARALHRLGHLLGETRYLAAAERILNSGTGAIQAAPLAHAAMLLAYLDQQHPLELVVLRGQGEALQTWHRRAARDGGPERMVFAIPSDSGALPPALADKTPIGETTAYICRGTTCSAPITDPEALDAALPKKP